MHKENLQKSSVILFVFLIPILSFSYVSAEDYYADIEITVDENGLVDISGISNHPGLLVENSNLYTYKKQSYWQINITKEEVFSDYIFVLTLPLGAKVNHIKTSGFGGIEEESGKAFQALSTLNITRDKISAAIDSVMRSADAPRSQKRLFMRQTSRACKVITNAIKESRKCQPRVLETEHLLLGLLSIPDCTAVRVLKTIGVSPDEVRQKVLNLTKKLKE